MTINLLDLLSQTMNPATVQAMAKNLGEPEAAVSSGLGALVPSILGGLASKVTAPGGTSSVFSMLTGPSVDTGVLSNFGTLLGTGQSGAVTNVGRSLMSGLFGGDKVGALGAALSGVSGLKSGTAGSLAALAAPLIFGTLKKLIGDRGFNPAATAALLLGQREHLAGRLNPALTAAVGLGTPAQLLSGLSAPVAGATLVDAGAASVATMSRWVPWAIAGLVGLALLGYYLLHHSDKAPEPTAPVAAPAVVAPTPAPASAPAVAAFDLKTPAKVYFDIGKSDFGAEGSAVVKSVADLMAKDPSISVDVTGYTDKTGDTASNQELAKGRALGVKAALVAAGVDGARIGTKPPMFVEVGAAGADADSRRVDISLK